MNKKNFLLGLSLLALSLFGSVLASPFACGKTVPENAAAATVIDFPNEQVGKFHFLRPGVRLLDDIIENKYYPAIGKVSVPAGKMLDLELNWVGGMNPQFLTKVPKSLIRRLTCRTMEIDNHGVASLTCQSEVHSLDIGDTDITDDIAPVLLKFPKLEALSLSCDEVGVKTIDAVCTMKKLVNLSVSTCSVPESTISQFGNLTELCKLELTGCRVTDGNLKAFEKLVNMQELVLGRSNITDSGVPSLLKMRKLSRLNLSDSKVTARGLLLLKAHPALKYVLLRMSCYTPHEQAMLKSEVPQIRFEEGTKARDWDSQMFAPLH